MRYASETVQGEPAANTISYHYRGITVMAAIHDYAIRNDPPL